MGELTEKQHREAMAQNQFRNGGKNARRVWFRGEIHNSIGSAGRAIGLQNPNTARNYIAKGHTEAFELILFYHEETFEKDFETAKKRVLTLLNGRLTHLQALIKEIENVKS